MKFVVVGADSQIGSEFVRLLSQTVSLESRSLADLDVADRAGLQRMFASSRPDVVLNCAAYSAVDKAESEPDTAYRINVLGARNVAQEARRAGARVVYFSTDYVFDGTASEPYAEDAPAAPLSVYGKTKLLGEQATREADPDHLIVRLAWLYSPAHGNFVRTILRRARQKDALRIVSDQTGSPTFTEDVVRQVLALINDGASGTYHCADTGHATWYEYGCNVVRAAGLNIPVIPIQTVDYPAPAVRPVFSVLADRNLDLEQINLMRPWQEALADCISRYIETLLHD